MNVKDHKNQTISGLKWNILNQAITQGISLLISVILMRVLEPKEFGILGMVTVFSSFLSVFNDFGLGSALIQNKNIDDLDRCTVFWTTIALGATLALLLIGISPWLAEFYNEQSITLVGQCLSLLFIFQALGGTHNALLRKQMKFKKLFWVSTLPVLVGGLFGIILAFRGFGIWTLVFQYLISGGLTMILLWFVSSFRPKLCFSYQRLRIHLQFSLPLVGSQSINYWSRNADNLLVGRFLGADVLGIYSRSYSIMMIPVSRISGIISSVMFPSLSLIQDDIERVRYIYLKVSRIIAFVTFPLMGTLIVIAEPLVKVLFGVKWLPIIFPLQILSIIGALQSIVTLNGNIFLSQGKNRLAFKITVVTGILLVVVFFIGAQYGITEVILLYLGITIFIAIPTWYLMGRIIACNLRSILLNLRHHVFLACFVVLFLLFLKKSFEYWLSDLQELVIWTFCFWCFWLLGMRIINKRHLLEVLDTAKAFRA